MTALTGAVSIHKYITETRGVYWMVDDNSVASHAGWGRLPPSDAWTNQWNRDSYGWEIEHKQGRPWNPTHLALCLDVVRADAVRLRLPALIRHRDLANGRPGDLGGNRTDPTDFPFWTSFRDLCMRPAYSFVGMPDISLDTWQRVTRHSLAGDAAEGYRRVVARGLRPGPILAMFGQESTYGTAGVSVQTKNWGNVRKAHKQSRVIGTIQGWPQYTTWLDSLDDVCERLLERSEYIAGGNDDITTVRCIWSPVGDGPNDPFADGVRMLGWIADWAKEFDMATVPGWGRDDYNAGWGIETAWEKDNKRLGQAITAEEYVDDNHSVRFFQRGLIGYRKSDGETTIARFG